LPESGACEYRPTKKYFKPLCSRKVVFHIQDLSIQLPTQFKTLFMASTDSATVDHVEAQDSGPKKLPFPPVTRSQILHCSYHYWHPLYEQDDLQNKSKLICLDIEPLLPKPVSFHSPMPSFRISAPTESSSLLRIPAALL
jgi:hypothetical protein